MQLAARSQYMYSIYSRISKRCLVRGLPGPQLIAALGGGLTSIALWAGCSFLVRGSILFDAQDQANLPDRAAYLQVACSCMAILDEDSPGRYQLDNPTELPNLQTGQARVLEAKQDYIIQPKLTAVSHPSSRNQEVQSLQKYLIPYSKYGTIAV